MRVNSVLPGVVRTPMAAALSEVPISRDEYLRLMPISRIGEPADIGKAVVFLLSDDASWITGQLIPGRRRPYDPQGPEPRAAVHAGASFAQRAAGERRPAGGGSARVG